MSDHTEPIGTSTRKGIDPGGENTLELERATGVSNSGLSRFLWGQRGLTPESVDRLARQRGLGIWWDASAAVFERDSEGVELADAFSTV